MVLSNPVMTLLLNYVHPMVDAVVLTPSFFMNIESMTRAGVERIEVARGKGGTVGIATVHSTKLGPGFGGMRIYPRSRAPSQEALLDFGCATARAMALKSALYNTPLGGGFLQLVVPDEMSDSETLRQAAEILNYLNGDLLITFYRKTGEGDMEFLLQHTEHLLGLPHLAGPPSAYTAHGVLAAMRVLQQAELMPAFTDTVFGLIGPGRVGGQVARQLLDRGVSLKISSRTLGRAVSRIAELSIRSTPLEPSAIFDAGVEVLVPCHDGVVVSKDLIPRLGPCTIVGCTNNQADPLLVNNDAELFELLRRHDVYWLSDLVVSAGAKLGQSAERVLGADFSVDAAMALVESRITEVAGEVIAEASQRGVTTHKIALERALRNLGS